MVFRYCFSSMILYGECYLRSEKIDVRRNYMYQLINFLFKIRDRFHRIHHDHHSMKTS